MSSFFPCLWATSMDDWRTSARLFSLHFHLPFQGYRQSKGSTAFCMPPIRPALTKSCLFSVFKDMTSSFTTLELVTVRSALSEIASILTLRSAMRLELHETEFSIAVNFSKSLVFSLACRLLPREQHLMAL